MKTPARAWILPLPTLASVLLLPLFAGPAGAQSQTGGGHVVTDPTLVPGPYTAIVSGDLDGNLSPEIAVIRGGVLIIYQNPDANDNSVEVASDVLDVCYDPNADGLGHPGLLYTSSTPTPTPLKVAVFNPVETRYETHLVTAPTQTAGATLIRYAPDLGLEKIFFTDGHTFYSAFAIAGGFSPATPMFTITQTARDFVLLNYADNPNTGDIGIDLGILHSTGFQLRSQHATNYLSRPIPTDAIAAVHCLGQSDSLALVTHTSAGQSSLILINTALYNSGGYPYPITILTGTYTSMAAADTDGDQRDDLALGRSQGSIDYLHNDQATSAFTWFLTTSPPPVDMTVPGHPETEMGRILWANVFNDRSSSGAIIPGFAAALPSVGGVSLVPGIHARLSLLSGSDFDRVAYRSTLHDDDSTTTDDCQVLPQHAARWTATLGLGWGSFGPTLPNALEMIVRRQRYDPIHHIYFPVDDEAFHHWIDNIAPGGVATSLVTFLTTSPGHDVGIPSVLAEGAPEKYFLQVRPIHRTLQNTTDIAWRWSTVGVSADCAALAQLRVLPFHLTPEVPMCSIEVCDPNVLACGQEGVDNAPCTAGFSVAQKIIPSAVPQSRVPSSGPGVLPIIGPPPF